MSYHPHYDDKLKERWPMAVWGIVLSIGAIVWGFAAQGVWCWLHH